MKKIGEDPQKHLADLVYREYTTAQSNQSIDDADFEAVIDMVECRRTEKEYDWMSDVFYPEFASIFNTEISQQANRYFQSREFVEVYLEGDKPEDHPKSQAAKKLINKTLNRRELYYFYKYIRGRSINGLRGEVVAVTGWEQELHRYQAGTRTVPYAMDVDIYGNDLVDREQIPAIGEREEPVYKTHIIKDHFNFEIIDPRNVFYADNNYTYSIQDKDGVIIRSEKSLEWLKEHAERYEYFNLDKLKDLQAPTETDTSKQSYNKDEQKRKTDGPVKLFDVLDRYGKVWAVVKERDQYGNPKDISWGLDEQGEPKSKAELVKAIVTVVVSGSTSTVIRFIPTPFVSADGKPYYPLVRGLCYIHPTKDVGMSDGKYSRELQIAINDTINLSNDRVKLATMPVFKGRKYSVEDNDQVYMEPEHVIPLEDMNDLAEIQIRDNIGGAMSQASMFINAMQQVNSVYPTTMGALPGESTTTATAVAGADARGNQRSNYKDLTFEYTFLTEFYWQILQMTAQFMRAETAQDILGEDVVNFDPSADYHYQPISSKIEAEYSKERKVQSYDQMIGRLSGLAKVNPGVIPIIAHIVGKELELLGAEFQDIEGLVKNLIKTPNNPEKGAEQTADGQSTMMSNQNNVPMSGMEQSARGLNV